MFRAAILLLLTTSVLVACGDDDDASQYSGEPTGRILFSQGEENLEDVIIMSADGSNPEVLIGSEAADREASVNSAGDTVAFTSLRGGQPDIWTMAMSGAETAQVTDDPALEARAVWSPDGSQVAYFSSRDQSVGRLWVTELTTGGSGPVLSHVANDAETACRSGAPTDWPMDNMIVYQGTQANISATQICSVDPGELDVSLILSEEDRVIFDGVVSPDGTKLAYTSDQTGNLEVWVSGIDASDPIRLTFDPGIDAWPSWAPDGQWLAFSSERDGDDEIYIIRPDGSDIRKLTDNDVPDRQPFWTN